MHTDSRQQNLWLLAAMAAPLAHFSGSGWLMTTAAALAVLPLIRIPKDWDGFTRAHALIQTLWLGTVAGILLGNSPFCWPSDNHFAVPLTLLALAAVTSAAAAPRVGAVLAFCIGLLLLPAAVSGAARIKPEWILPTTALWPWALTLVLLLPNLPASGGQGRPFVIGGIGVLLALLVQGTLSSDVAAAVPDPFYQTARTLGHLEPITAAAMTLGWYALATGLLRSAAMIAGKEKWPTILAAGTASAVIITKVQLSQQTLALFSAVLWVLIPFLNKIKKSEKSEK